MNLPTAVPAGYVGWYCGHRITRSRLSRLARNRSDAACQRDVRRLEKCGASGLSLNLCMLTLYRMICYIYRCTPIVEMMMISRAFVHASVVRLAVILIGTFE